MKRNWIEVERMSGGKVTINFDNVHTVSPFTTAFADRTPKEGCTLEFFNGSEMKLKTTYEQVKYLLQEANR